MTSGQPSSVDPDQVAFYTRLADRWWDESGPFWPLHLLNALRQRWIIDRVATGSESKTPLEGLRILDIGCGGGLLSEGMARAGAVVSGIDVTERNIKVARLHAEQIGLAIDYRHSSAEALAAAGERFDVVLNMEVVEHVADLDGFMKAACALVADEGSMFVATLNRSWAGFLIGIIGAEYVTGLLPRGTHQWSRFVRPRELQEKLRADGLEVVDSSGVKVNPWRRRMALSSWMGVNYMVHARRERAALEP